MDRRIAVCCLGEPTPSDAKAFSFEPLGLCGLITGSSSDVGQVRVGGFFFGNFPLPLLALGPFETGLALCSFSLAFRTGISGRGDLGGVLGGPSSELPVGCSYIGRRRDCCGAGPVCQKTASLF